MFSRVYRVIATRVWLDRSIHWGLIEGLHIEPLYNSERCEDLVRHRIDQLQLELEQCAADNSSFKQFAAGSLIPLGCVVDAFCTSLHNAKSGIVPIMPCKACANAIRSCISRWRDAKVSCKH